MRKLYKIILITLIIVISVTIITSVVLMQKSNPTNEDSVIKTTTNDEFKKVEILEDKEPITNEFTKSAEVAIDTDLIELIKDKMLSDCLWEDVKEIQWHSWTELKIREEIELDAEYNEFSDYYFDIDNDKIKDRIRYDVGTAAAWCEISYGQGEGKFIKGNLSGGIYDANTFHEETEGMVGNLRLFTYKDVNYMLNCFDNNDRITSLTIYLYKNTELKDKIVLNKKMIKTSIAVEISKDEANSTIFEKEGREILKDYDACAYPRVCLGDAETEIMGDNFGYTSYNMKCDINNDEVEEHCLKYNVGGYGEIFEYKINEDSEYLNKYGLTYENIGAIKGFWVDKVEDKNILKLISYDGRKYYFRCYIIEWNVVNEIFSMSCCPEFDIVINE